MKTVSLWLQRKKAAFCILAGICSLSLFVIYNSGEKITNNKGGAYAIKIRHYGIDAEEMERSVTIPLEDALFSIPGVMSVQSSSENSLSNIFVRFKNSERNGYEAVRDAVQRVYETLPSSVQRPEILSSNNSIVPVWSAAVISGVDTDSPDEAENFQITQILETTVKPLFESLDGAGEVVVSGAGSRQILIILDQEKLFSLGLQASDVSGFLAGNDSVFSGGSIINQNFAGLSASANREIIVMVDGRYNDENLSITQSLERALIPLGEGNFIELSGIAKVLEQERTPDILSRLNGQKAAGIAVMGQHGADLRKLSFELGKALSSLSLPLEFIVLSDLGAEEEAAFNSVLNAALTGALMVAVICYLLNRKNTFSFSGIFCAVLVPLICLVSAAVLLAFGFSSGRFLPAGIAAGVGTAVDSVILCSEKFRKCANYSSAAAALSSLPGPLAAGASTTVIALLPLAMIDNSEVKIISFGIAAVTITALIISLTLLPPLFLWNITQYDKQKRALKRTNAKLSAIVRKFNRLLAFNARFCIKYPLFVLLAGFSLTAGAVIALLIKGADTADYGSENSIYAQAEFDGALIAEEVDRLLASYSMQLASFPGIKNIETGARTGSGSLLISFDPSQSNAHQIRETAKNISLPGGFIFFNENTSMSRNWEIKIYGNEDEKCRDIAKELAVLCSRHHLIKECVLNFKEGGKKLYLTPDREIFAGLNISFSNAALAARLGVFGPVAYKKIFLEDEIDIRFITGGTNLLLGGTDDVLRQTKEGALGLFVSASQNLESLMYIVEETDTSGIKRDNRRRTASITIATKPMDPGRLKRELESLFNEIDMPPGYYIEFDPDALKESEALIKTIFSLLMAVVFSYMIMASITESFTVPLIVLAAIPVSLSIPALFLALSGNSYNLSAACAFIAVSGMTVNAAVITIDCMRSYARKSPDSTCLNVYKSYRKKMPALLSTTGTTIAGAVPFFFLKEGANSLIRMLSLIGALGIAGSFICSITIIPSVYSILKNFDFPKKDFTKANNPACAG